MKNFHLPLFLCFLVVGCATYKTKYAEATTLGNPTPDAEVAHTFYLVGDAGLSPNGGMNAVLRNVKTKLSEETGESSIIFLGDNIYPAGLPKKGAEGYAAAINQLDAQIDAVSDFKGQTIFIPGNHDWYSDGLKGLKRQEKYIEDALGKGTFAPQNGCPIEKIEISDDIVVIAIDTEWYVTDWDKHPTINDECEIKDRNKFFEEIEGLVKKNRDKTTILALHHPMFTYGSHGGYHSFKQHLFPTHGNFPLPVLGSLINLLRKTTGASPADIQNQRYNTMKKRMVTLAQYSEKVIFVSGHEHTLQYIVEDNTPQIVSGSGAKKGATRLLNGSKFSTGHMGYAVLKVYEDGASHVEYFGVEDENATSLYTTEVLPAKRKAFTFSGSNDVPAQVEASVYSDAEIDKTGFYKTVWGDRYREFYATKVKAPTVRLDTLFGGLTPVRKGGGHQSKSLRLQHEDGRQFVMRALRKSAELYLQALAFQEEYIIGDFEETFTEAILQDFYTGSHPYAPFTIGPLSDAVGIYHTNPKLYYIPKQAALEEYNETFGDELYMIEEHVSEGHDIASFGYAKKIESTDDMIKKLRKDEDYFVDASAYVKARLFDMMIGDWDRHVDQWRWVQEKDGNGNKVFKPIPRDRDQAFSIMGDGALMGFATRTVPTLRLFEGFNEEIRSVRGFNSSPMTYALDLALFPQTTLEDWVREAKYIQDHIDAAVIDGAFESFPNEVRGATTERIKNVLLARKADLVETAKAYYGILNKYSVITGTDKDDYFVINSLNDGMVDVKAYRIKKGEKADLFFDKRYDPSITKELWIYGLDDDDVFEVNSNSGAIKVRLIGGQNNDVYKIAQKARAVHTYDFKSKENTYDEAFGGHLHKIDDYDTNTYQFLKIKASNNQLLPAIGFNPDDGVRLGLTNTYTFNGFRQNPFTQQHTVNALFYFATSGVDLSYNGEFANIFENVNLELNARFTSPNFAINFFGFGNETVNNDDDEPLELDFNRVKIQTITFGPALVWRGELGSKFSLGASYENYDVEETEGRFIEGFFTDQGRDTEQDFFGMEAGYSYSNSDYDAFPTLGMAFSLQGGFKTNLGESGREFGYIIPSLAIDHKLVADGSLVLATKVKGHFNIGNNYEFYQAASIGANNGLRGFRFQRFTGRSAFFQNTDLRLSFRQQKTGLLPVTPGIFGGFDYGRVWFPGDDSNKWHNSYGGGFFVNGANVLSANVGVFNSSDGIRFAFGLGFGF
ncbi:MAG: metallophosphoesterase [Flavobacteriaceae bacterium]|nr:metallophosphoesterase [Flavobacteriaceae bacterium]